MVVDTKISIFGSQQPVVKALYLVQMTLCYKKKQKLITKCVKFIITKCDNFITKCVGTTNNKSKKESEKIWRSNLVKNQNIDFRIKLTKIYRPLLLLTL